MLNNNKPFISADENLPEITLKAILLGILLAIFLAASNAYLGLKVGITVSGSIPAAVIAMGILSFFRHKNILEINIIQTAASVGEASAAACIFTFPALLISQIWFKFNYSTMFFVLVIGGVIGVLFSVLTRRVLLDDKTLKFPEGVAIGNVLKASVSSTSSLKYLIQGGAIGACINFFQSGLQVMKDSVAYWFVKDNTIFGVALDFSPALIAAGYIIGINIAISFLVGMVITWGVMLPVLTHHYVTDFSHLAADVGMIQKQYIRYVGVGTLTMAGLWTILGLFKPIKESIMLSFGSLKAQKSGRIEIPRTEKDLPIQYVLLVIGLLMIPLLIILASITNAMNLGLSSAFFWGVMGITLVVVMIVAFIVASVNGYFAGMVGTSSSPISSTSIAASILIALMLYFLFGLHIHFESSPEITKQVVAIVLIAVAFICSISVITNGSIQDFKAGEMVGATPWKQQVMVIIGVLASALVLPFITELLFEAYGIGGIYPREGMDPTQNLSAPQATLIATVSTGMFGSGLNLQYLYWGLGIGAFFIAVDEFLKKRYALRLPVMGIGLGIYLPLGLTMALFLGGLFSWIVKLGIKKQAARQNEAAFETEQEGKILSLACGLVAGASIIGVFLAIPFALFKSTDILNMMPTTLDWLKSPLSYAAIIGLFLWIYKIAITQR